MTRKDYVLIAQALLACKPTVHQHSVMHAQHKCDCESIANWLARSNPRFDRERFLEACGVQS